MGSIYRLEVAVKVATPAKIERAVEIVEQLAEHVSHFEQVSEDNWYHVEVVDFESRDAAIDHLRKTLEGIDGLWSEYLDVRPVVDG